MAHGVGLVIRRQRVLWWLFLVNFVLGVIAVLPVHLTLGDLLNHSLASRSMADHFDLSSYIELVSSPQFNFGIFRSLSLFTSLVFAFIVLFAEPGVIQEYRHAAGANAPSRRQTAGEFFGACGEFLARMVRLLLWSLILLFVLVVYFALASIIVPNSISSEMSGPKLAVEMDLLFLLLLFLPFAAMRLWISMAEIELVASGEQQTFRTLFGAARRLTFGNFGKLYAIQLVTSIATLAVTLAGLTIWVRSVPPAAVFWAFIVSETTLLLLLACRLWQRASLVIWYERWISLQPKTVEQPLPSLPQEPVAVVDQPFTSPVDSDAPYDAGSTSPHVAGDNPPGPIA
jgi:hypothetical protein